MLYSFEKGKNPGSDGFTPEFFLGFYDLIKKDILAVVQESRKSGKVLGSMNNTFIALIPKKHKCEAFEDYIPISCCNMIYKVIAKIIAQRIKPILSKVITEEQFGFLQNRQILDVISIAQEVIHTIKKEKLGIALKLNLSKDYDKVSCTFIRLVLIKLGMNMEMVDWILGCIQSTSFAVLINGSPSEFFRPSRGIKQVCPLSPFIFLLVASALSRLILKSRTKGRITGKSIKV